MAEQKKTRLDKAQVADTALDLLNDVGLEGLTLRAIAKELNVQAPALYWHFKNKQALLDEMATVMFRRMTQPGVEAGADPGGEAGADAGAGPGAPAAIPHAPGMSWQDWLVEGNRRLRATLLRYRDGAKVFSGSQFTGTEHGAQIEANLRVFAAAGFTAEQAAWASTTAYLYTVGFVTEEQGVQPLPGERRAGYDVDERAERLAAYPLAAAAGKDLFTAYDERFEEGLALIVAGIEARYSPS
ncbi:TetR family transcriptional regulator [Streptomyces sp. SID5785]|uniref:TetR/AcrR family transcriptional regulator C-terminal domain-containing protein n=1 Tax=Streptomyces sp. SID5785 TaxID=2690309 RepID=UPI0013616E6A|nr:TetR family transcriptional regulator [Streptomyces sp. SID5785]